MKSFEFLEHTGDVKIRAFGKTQKDLFLSAMLGMNEIIGAKRETASAKRLRKIKLKAPDINALLADFLSEINYLIQIKKEIYEKIKFLQFSDQELEAEIEGREVESFNEEIKAVTHHGLNIIKNEKGIWQTEVLFDI